MPRRGENIRKRKDGRWEARFAKGRDSEGKTVYGSVYGKSYREAKEKQALGIQEIRSGIIEDTAASENFGRVIELWMEHDRIFWKGATLRKYQYLAEKHILPELGEVPISQITGVLIHSFLTKKLTLLSAAYTRTMAQIIASALRFAVDENLCSPVNTKVSRPASVKREIEVLSLQEQRRLEHYLLSRADHTGTGILLALHTGLRIGEVCALSWDDVDLDCRVIHVRHTLARITETDSSGTEHSRWIQDNPKTGASLREIPIPSMLWAYLKSTYRLSDSQYVVSASRDYVNPRTFEYRYHRILDECGVASINFHALRHTFATRCIEAGVDVKSLSEMLGHASVSITLNTYVHSSMELKRQQIEKVSELSA